MGHIKLRKESIVECTSHNFALCMIMSWLNLRSMLLLMPYGMPCKTNLSLPLLCIKLKRLQIKFHSYQICLKHKMRQHLMAMPKMVKELKFVGKKPLMMDQVYAMIRFLPLTFIWKDIERTLTNYNGNI